MSMFPHTVTVYNLTEDQDTFEKVYNITVLRGVLVDTVQAAGSNKSGLLNGDQVVLYIPFSVDAGGKRFLPEKAYEAIDDKAAYWTLRVGKDFFAKGEAVGPGWSFDQANAKHGDVYRVATLGTKDFGSPAMRHWEAGGR